MTKGGAFGPAKKGWVLFREGEKLVTEGKAERVHCTETGRNLGYRLTSSEESSAPRKPVMEMERSETVLTPEEVDAVVGEHCRGGKNILGVDGGPPGRSLTAGLNSHQRRMREALGFEDVDFVERARYKLDAFDPRHGRRVVAVAAIA
jgi:hypothetical protein